LWLTDFVVHIPPRSCSSEIRYLACNADVQRTNLTKRTHSTTAMRNALLQHPRFRHGKSLRRRALPKAFFPTPFVSSTGRASTCGRLGVRLRRSPGELRGSRSPKLACATPPKRADLLPLKPHDGLDQKPYAAKARGFPRQVFLPRPR